VSTIEEELKAAQARLATVKAKMAKAAAERDTRVLKIIKAEHAEVYKAASAKVDEQLAKEEAERAKKREEANEKRREARDRDKPTEPVQQARANEQQQPPPGQFHGNH